MERLQHRFGMAFGDAEEGGRVGDFGFLMEEEESVAWALEQATPHGPSSGGF